MAVKVRPTSLPEISRATTSAGSPPLALGYRGFARREAAGRWRDPARGELVKTSVAEAAAATGLTLIVLSSLALVSFAAARPSWLSPIGERASVPGWLAGPLGGLSSGLTLTSSELDTVFTVLVSVMFVSYLAIVMAAPRLRPAWAIGALGAVLAVHVIYFLAPPMQLTDIFNYLNYARMDVVHGLNPYTTIPALEPPSDPTFLLSNWHGLLSPYGPLMTLLTLALVPLGVAGSVWAFKAVLMVLSLAILLLVWRCAELLGKNALKATLFVGLNPLVLVWGLGGDHNDVFMMFPVMLAVYLLLSAQTARVGLRPSPGRRGSSAGRRAGGNGVALRLFSWLDGAPRPLPDGEPRPYRELGAGVAIAAAIAIKASAGVLAPVILLGVARRTRFAVGLAVGLLAAGVATWLAFGLNLPDLTQQERFIVQTGVPNLVGYVAGLGGETSELHRIFAVILVLGVVACSLWAGRTRDWIAVSGWVTLLTLLTLSWMLPSYALWLLPFAALARGRALRIAAIAFSVYVFLFWMPYAWALEHFLHLHLSTTTVAQSATSFQRSLEH